MYSGKAVAMGVSLVVSWWVLVAALWPLVQAAAKTNTALVKQGGSVAPTQDQWPGGTLVGTYRSD